MAESLLLDGREEDAVALFNGLAKERPERYSPLVALANHYRYKKEYENAVEAYGRALARIPEFSERHWSILFGRGMAFERLKNWERAEKDFLQAMELSSDQPLLLNYLGYSWVDQGTNLERGLKLIKQAVAARPNSGYIVDSLGWAYYRLKDYRKAVTQLERAVELRPDDPTINDHLGDAYWRVGREIEARYQWKKALSFDPEEDQIPVIRKKVREGLTTADDS